MSFRSSSMDTCSSGEELTVKARKPYTITKQRERWTEEEHNLFLEALKLYGRAWQRIEEHIGTKTAVQIRSHAQKFLTKLEKEALSKGISLKQAIDIEIPPPRPKRKPSNPYPRKICLGIISSSKGRNSESPSISISSDQSKTLQLKNATSPENLAGSDCSERTKVVSEKGNCSETLRLFQDVPSHSFASEKRNSGSPRSFRKFVPSLKEIKKKPEFDKSGQTANENKEAIQCTDSTDNDIGLCLNLQTKVAPMKRHVQHKSEEEGSNCELQATKERERHLSVHSTDMNNENCMHSNPQIAISATTQPGSQVHPNPSVVDPSVMVTPENLIHSTASFHQERPTFPPFTLFHNNQDAYKSFNMSSTFSNFILSTLLQNPAAHAAASLASSFWSSVGDTTNCASEVLNSGVPPKHTNTSLNMAVIASATVAAATAWWATHGLFPLCHPPLSNGFSIAVAPATSSANFTNRSPEERVVTKGDNSRCQAHQDEHILDSESPEATGLQRSTSKSMPLSSSDSESRGDKPHGSEGNGSEVKELLMPKIDPNECGDITRNAKKTSIYSCGSNKLSSTEKEIKTTLDENKPEIYKESKEPEKYSLLIEAKNRRFRNSGSMNESWKEVSEEGRIAFQALFSRDVLPQSFSPPNVEETATNLNNDVIVARTPVDLSINVFADEVVDRVPSMECETSKSSYHSILLCKNGLVKLRANHTGFQPYKRCSMEAENTTSVGDEKTSKRSRLEEEALTR